jgi:hypothetical protein
MGFNPTTGLWEDDQHPDGGSLGDQAAAPVMAPNPAPLPESGPSPPVGPQDAPSPMPSPGNVVKIDEPFNISAGPDAPVPPQAVPGGPAAAPALPNVQPASPQLPPPIPAGRVVTPAEQANLAGIDANTAAQIQTAQQKGQTGGAEAAAKVHQADAAALAQQKFIEERQKIADDAAARIAAREQQANQDLQAYKAFGLKDPDADKSFGRKVLEAIAVTLGAYGSGLTHQPNQALQMIDEANKENIDRQKAQQEKLFQQAQASGKNVEEARKVRDDAFKQLDLKHSALLDSSVAQLNQQLARIGVPQAQIDANADIQKLAGQAMKLRENTLQSIRGDETTLAKEDIAAAAKRAKAAARGGAGGAGGTSWMDAAKEAAQQPGATPMSVAKAAQEAGYGGKLTTLLASAKGEIADAEKQTGGVSKQMDDFEKQVNGTGGKLGPAAQLSRLTAMRAELGQAIASGDAGRAKAAVTAITEEAGGMLSGGKTTKFTSTLLDGLKSTGDEFKEHFSKIVGDPNAGQTFKANLDKLLAGVANEKRTEIDEIRSNAVNQTMGAGGTAASPAAKRLALSRFAGITGGVKDENGKPIYDEGGKQAAAAPAPRAAAPSTGQQAQALQWARANPRDPRAAKILQALGQ